VTQRSLDVLMNAWTQGRGASWSNRQLAASWMAVFVGALLLTARYPELPDAIPAYRTLRGAPTHALPKSLFSVFRIVALGVGQLGATTVMTREATRAQQPNWATFWLAASMAAGAKTLIECVQYALLGVVEQARLELPFMLAALLPVAAFFVVALRLWRAGSLEARQAISLSRLLVLAAFLLLWLICAVLPRWMSS
jgi:uncharacterized membrane protein